MRRRPEELGYSCGRLLVELENKPIQFCRDADEDLADDVDHLAMLGINSAAAARAGGKKDGAVLGREKQPDCNALFWCRYRLRVWQVAADRHLTLCRGP